MQNEKIQETDTIANSRIKKILFFHNTLPEYRIGWFMELDKRADVEFVFTNEKLNEKDYGFKIEYAKVRNLKCTFLSEGIQSVQELHCIMKNAGKYDFVELPPIDSFRDVIYSGYIVCCCKKAKVSSGYFWEKWEAPKSRQPLKRKIKNWILRVVPKMIYKHVDVLFSVGTKNKEYFLSNGIDEGKIHWIPDVSETPKCEYFDLRAKYGISKKSTLILYLGRILPQKGVADLIQAYDLLDEERKRSSFLLVAGDGRDLDNCKRLAEKLKLENIRFIGSVNPKERGNYFEQCDIFVYPVNYWTGWVDVWGLTINEAVQHGKVVITTDAVGSAYELIENGVNGYRIRPGDIEQLKNTLIEAASSKIIKSTQIKDSEINKIYNFANMAQLYINAIDVNFDT